MEKTFFFKNAAWVGKAERTEKTFTVLRGRFNISELRKVTLNVLGLGFFKCYINGKCINPDTFLPLSSDYEASCDPCEEVLSGHRVYVPSFDITSLVTRGENFIVLHFGGDGIHIAVAFLDFQRPFIVSPNTVITERSTILFRIRTVGLATVSSRSISLYNTKITIITFQTIGWVPILMTAVGKTPLLPKSLIPNIAQLIVLSTNLSASYR